MRPAWWRPCQLHVAAEGEFLSCRLTALSWKAAAVKLENQRLREEIRQAVEVAEVKRLLRPKTWSSALNDRAMCTTIKSQSSQLSDLWAETQRLQVPEGTGGIEGFEVPQHGSR